MDLLSVSSGNIAQIIFTHQIFPYFVFLLMKIQKNLSSLESMMDRLHRLLWEVTIKTQQPATQEQIFQEVRWPHFIKEEILFFRIEAVALKGAQEVKHAAVACLRSLLAF
jgi:hypothetical protein